LPWIKRQSMEHKCAKPTGPVSGPERVVTGDEWECDVCGTRWRVTIRSDQRESWIEWTETV
jgi:hypothetical protein